MSAEEDKQRLLTDLGAQVRALRLESGLTVKDLAERAALSMRFVVQLESGKANISIAGLARLAGVLGRPVQEVIPPPSTQDSVRAAVWNVLSHSTDDDIQAFQRWLSQRSGKPAAITIALIGLRGAGKSTIGPLLASRLKSQFIEVDAMIEQAAGMPVGEIFMMHGEEYYRRLEREALIKLFSGSGGCVLATGGSIVTDAGSWEMVKRRCFTVWLHATPQEFMKRLRRQGDTRPMKSSRSAMEELKLILARREPLYGEADLTVRTTGKTPAKVLVQIASALESR